MKEEIEKDDGKGERRKVIGKERKRRINREKSHREKTFFLDESLDE